MASEDGPAAVHGFDLKARVDVVAGLALDDLPDRLMGMDAVRTRRGIPQDGANALISDLLSPLGRELGPDGRHPRIQARGIHGIAGHRTGDWPLPVPQKVKRVLGIANVLRVWIDGRLFRTPPPNQHHQLAEEGGIAGQPPVEML